VSWWRRPSTSSFAESARRLVGQVVTADEFSGVLVIARDGEVVAEAASGFADRAAGRKATVDTRYATASVTKMFTAAAVARLADRGLVAFDAAVRDVLPRDWYPDALDETATVHNLLTHTSNLSEYVPDEDPTTPDLWQALGTPAMRRATDFLPILAALPQGSPPGPTATYCNAGYLVLGLVLEATTGVPFATTIEKEVFQVCGMADSAFQPFDELGEDTAVGYLPLDAEDRSWRTNEDLLPFAGSIREADTRLAPRVTPALLAEVASAIPREWLDDGDVQTYATYLERRIAEPRAFVAEAERARERR
jgi:CubicO group peptidase (beta-lactamase class C family)